jgi:anti-sigma-K factor RskA
MSCEHRDDAGAWLLGALSDDERARFEAHLAGCEICRGEVDELQMVADTLPLAAPQVAPPPELKERIMSVVRAEAAQAPAGAAATAEPDVEPERPAVRPESAPPKKERRRWWRLPSVALRPIPAAVAAAVLIAIGVAGGVLLSGNDGSERTVQAQVVTPSAPGARASLTTTSHDRATLSVRDFPAPPRGRVYQVWLKRPGRPPDPTTALFTVRDGDATVEVPGSVAGVDQVLVTAEPHGGSRKPTRAPVIIAQPA